MARFITCLVAVAVLSLAGSSETSAAVLGNHQKLTRVLPGQPFGNGTTDLTVSASATYSVTRNSTSGTAGSTTLYVAAMENFPSGTVVLLHQSRGTNAGRWEVNQVASSSGTGGGNVTVVQPLAYTYTDSGESQAQIFKIPMYNNITVNSSITWTVPAWDSNVDGVMVLAAQGTVTINGTIDANAKGYVGGAAVSGNTAGRRGEGTAGVAGAQTTAANQTAAGGGYPGQSGQRSAGGGGGGGHAAAGITGNKNDAKNSIGGTGGAAGGSSDATTLIFGGGGGGGGSTNDGGSSGAGGRSGGIVIIFAKTINFGTSGLIRANGSNGGNASGAANGGGGGGSGGAVLLVGQNMSLGTNRITVAYGSGGTRTTDAGAGREGALGRITVHRSGTVSGSSSPAFYNQLDASLVPNAFPNAPANPLCEGQSNPVNLNVETPQFSWTFSDPDAGDTQSAYQILLGTTAADGSVWDSGKVSSSSSSVTCGQSLTSGMAYKWKVRVWDPSDFVSEYCAEQSFTLQSPPTAFDLTSPTDSSYLTNPQVAFAWTESTDPESQPISYTLQIDESVEFAEPVVREITGISTPSYTLSAQEALPDGAYYWRVVASDGSVTTASTQSWILNIDTVLPDVPTLNEMETDLATGGIVELSGLAEGGSTLTFYSWSSTGSHTTIAGDVSWSGNTFTFNPQTPLSVGSAIFLISRDAAMNTSQSGTYTLAFDSVVDVYRDDSESHGDDGHSMRLELNTVYVFRIAVNGGSPLTISAWLKRNSDYSGTAPSITLSGLGINGTGAATKAMTGPADTWEQLTVVGTPNATGILTLTVRTSSTAAGSATWVDDIAVSQ